MRFKSSVRNYGIHSPTSPDSKLKKNKSRKYATMPSSIKMDTRRKLDNFTDAAYNEAVSRLRVLLHDSYSPKITTHLFDDSGDETDDKSVFSNFTRVSKHYHTPVPYKRDLVIPKQSVTNQLSKDPPSTELMSFIERQEDYINQLEKESQYCRHELSGLLDKVKEVISENEQLHKKQKIGIMKSVTDTFDTTETDEDPTDITSTKKYTTTSKRPLEGPAIVFESRISELEAQLTQYKIDLKKKQDENEMLQRQLSENVLCDSPAFKKQLEMLQREKENLQDTISKLQMNAALDNDHNMIDKKQMEQTRWERERTEAKLRRLQSELQRVTDNSAEQARRFASERVTLQSEQSQSTAEKSSLEQELANAKLNADCTERAHKQECGRLQSEITSLRQRLDRADADALHMRRENMRLTEKLSSLEKELNLNKLLTENRNNSSYGELQKESLPIMALPPPRESSDSTREKDLTSMVKNIEAKHEATVAELEEMIQSQNALMEKLTGECHTLTKKLEESSVKHKNEIAKLQNSLKTLSSKLDDTQKNTANNFRMKEKHNTPIKSDNYSKLSRPEETKIKDQYPEQNGYDKNSNNYAKEIEKTNEISPTRNYNDKNYLNVDDQDQNAISSADEKQDYETTYEETYPITEDNDYITNTDNTNYTEQYNDRNAKIPENTKTEYDDTSNVTKYAEDSSPYNQGITNEDQGYDNTANIPQEQQPYVDPNQDYDTTTNIPQEQQQYIDPNQVYDTTANIPQEQEQYIDPNQVYDTTANIPQEQQQYIDPNQGYEYPDNQNYIPDQQYSENMEYQMDPNYSADQQYDETAQNQSYSDQPYDESVQNQNYTEQEYAEQPQGFIEEESRPPETNNG
ncbi:serologically defined colon cancer antigen 8 homolog isoform X2 [Chrysoperla carnea]|uniref:serologically defined colon cancer antigen 8 homolog isoform X2 n=1 Tax=Chrysoperla carnea TaxID=189513 RepID=UPI001D074A19|nr:serologically defined colon cancer antigen 8 homolog isoform X2 [Chrysoperla carnea]